MVDRKIRHRVLGVVLFVLQVHGPNLLLEIRECVIIAIVKRRIAEFTFGWSFPRGFFLGRRDWRRGFISNTLLVWGVEFLKVLIIRLIKHGPVLAEVHFHGEIRVTDIAHITQILSLVLGLLLFLCAFRLHSLGIHVQPGVGALFLLDPLNDFLVIRICEIGLREIDFHRLWVYRAILAIGQRFRWDFLYFLSLSLLILSEVELL